MSFDSLSLTGVKCKEMYEEMEWTWTQDEGYVSSAVSNKEYDTTVNKIVALRVTFVSHFYYNLYV